MTREMDATQPVITLTDAPDAQAIAAIGEGLSAYNLTKAGYQDHRPLAVLIADPVTKATVGGLLGRTSLGLFFVDIFFLPEQSRIRGLGSRILRQAEDEARRRGCGAVLLYTITFQAEGFYARNGYEVLGRVECDPPGHTRIVMTKRLTTPAA
ncbi:MAG TPA: GNAT family N-acetyltransferase [Stellaceae bacterium]|nr:GNAT family N-acetyltransferase [Stellaceae bacterium]